LKQLTEVILWGNILFRLLPDQDPNPNPTILTVPDGGKTNFGSSLIRRGFENQTKKIVEDKAFAILILI
jgi:hypothetical protein